MPSTILAATRETNDTSLTHSPLLLSVPALPDRVRLKVPPMDPASRSVVLATGALWIVLGLTAVVVRRELIRKAIGAFLVLLGISALLAVRGAGSSFESSRWIVSLSVVAIALVAMAVAPQRPAGPK